MDALKDVYANASMRSNDHEITYRGYTLKKAEWTHPDHTEYAVMNRDGTQVESYTVHAFDSVDALQTSLDDLIDYNPDTAREWLNREQEDEQEVVA